MQFKNDAPYNSGGGINTLERATDFLDAMDSIGGQLVTSLGASKLNELRVQYAHRHQSSNANVDSGTGPAVLVSGVAGFGAPTGGTGQGNAGFDFKQNITQVVDNFTLLRGAHSYKIGFDWQHIYDERTAAPQFIYTFPTSQAYLDAKNGINPLSYTTMTQLTGELGFNMSTNLFSLFIQDDWQVLPSLKLLYGLRYDLYKYRRASRPHRWLRPRASTSTRTTSVRALVSRGRSTRARWFEPAPGSCTTRPFWVVTSRRCSCPGRLERRCTRSTRRRQVRRGFLLEPPPPALLPSSHPGPWIRTSRSLTRGSRTYSSSARLAAT